MFVCLQRTPAEEITFETLKNAIGKSFLVTLDSLDRKCLRCAVVYGCVSALVDSVGMEELERERRRQVVEKFQKAPFEEIAAHCGARVRQRYNNI